MYKIAKENLSALFQAIAGEQDLYLPVNNNGQVNFAAWTEGANVDLDTLKSVKSPKDAFFPQSENLYTVKTEDKKMKVEAEAFADDSDIADYAKDAVYYLRNKGIISGTDNGNYEPLRIMTRAEAAVVVNNIIKLGK